MCGILQRVKESFILLPVHITIFNFIFHLRLVLAVSLSGMQNGMYKYQEVGRCNVGLITVIETVESLRCMQSGTVPFTCS